MSAITAMGQLNDVEANMKKASDIQDLSPTKLAFASEDVRIVEATCSALVAAISETLATSQGAQQNVDALNELSGYSISIHTSVLAPRAGFDRGEGSPPPWPLGFIAAADLLQTIRLRSQGVR